ncbi:MAG: hypothetical protein MJ154_03560 [Candidatus Saccharibacteria bacterium]|nr:hypothetical protein [Candidatus Saccharibacteria bacterium]
MSNNVLYYDCLLNLCAAVGEYVCKRELYYDIKDGKPPSPASIKTLAKYYEGSVENLSLSYKRTSHRCNKEWLALKEFLENAGAYDKEDAKTFYQQLTRINESCDFRAKVRDWARAELAKERKGKESAFYNMRDMLDRYEKLVLKRRNKK